MPLGQSDLANAHTAGQSHGASVVLMLAPRLRRWSNIWSALPIRPTINARCCSQQTLDVDAMLF